MNKKKITGIGLIILSGICVLLLQRYLSMPMAKVPVIRLTGDVAKGSVITESMIKTVEISADALTPQVIQSKDMIVGHYALSDLYANDMINKNAITNANNYEQELFLSKDLNKKYVSVTLKNMASSLSARLLPGDIVSIYSVDENKVSTNYKELQYVKVVSMTNILGQESVNDGSLDIKDEIANTITLEVNEIQALKLVHLENTNVLHFAFVYRGQEAQAEAFLKNQDEIIKGGN